MRVCMGVDGEEGVKDNDTLINIVKLSAIRPCSKVDKRWLRWRPNENGEKNVAYAVLLWFVVIG